MSLMTSSRPVLSVAMHGVDKFAHARGHGCHTPCYHANRLELALQLLIMSDQISLRSGHPSMCNSRGQAGFSLFPGVT
jgi:hypothetical protein